MNSIEFCYWLRGAHELSPVIHPTAEQWAIIREHLDLATAPTEAAISTKAQRFCDWLQGYARLTNCDYPDAGVWLLIQADLAKVFVQVTKTSITTGPHFGGIPKLRTLELRPGDHLSHLPAGDPLRNLDYSQLTLTC